MPTNPRVKYHRVNDSDGYVDAQVRCLREFDIDNDRGRIGETLSLVAGVDWAFGESGGSWWAPLQKATLHFIKDSKAKLGWFNDCSM